MVANSKLKRWGGRAAAGVLAAALCLPAAFLPGLFRARAAEVVTAGAGVSAEKHARITDAEGLSDHRDGIRLSSSVSGSKIEFTDTMKGAFELDFRVYTETAFRDPTGGRPFGNAPANDALALNTLTFTFSDPADPAKAFGVAIDGKSAENYATPSASVTVGGKRAGIYYKDNDGGTWGNTTGANAAGLYTALWRTSFSNAGYASEAAPLAGPESMILCFDPVSLTVSCKSAGNPAGYLIWDFSKEYADGRGIGAVFTPFSSYRVSVEFTDVAPGKTARAMLYSLNGQGLAGLTHVNDKGPGVFADFDRDAVKGEKYALPAPETYDVLGNETARVAAAASIGGASQTVLDAQGAVTGVWSAGCYIIPSATGDMAVTYTARDAQFDGIPLKKTVKAYDTAPATSFRFAGRRESGDAGAGTVITVPAATAENPMIRGALAVTATVSSGGAPLAGLENKPASEPFTFTAAGDADYTVEYAAAGVSDRASFAVNSRTDLPAFKLLGAFPETARVGDRFVFPSAEASFNGETKAAALRFTMPDGGVYGAYSLMLEQPGLYKVEYSAVFGGKTYTRGYEASAADLQATFTGGNTGDVTDNAPSLRYDAVRGVRIEASNPSFTYTYSRAVDLSLATKDDLLLEIYNSAVWNSGSAGVKIFLTDARDPSNVVTIRSQTHYALPFANTLSAAAPGQTYKGFEGSLHDDDEWGTQSAYNARGTVQGLPYERTPLRLWYDNAEKSLYTELWGKSLIVKLDDPAYQQTLWKGFTTGEAYISITDFSGVVVTRVFGDDLAGDSFTDRTPPTIGVDLGGYAEADLPKAVVGKPYRVFNCSAVDGRQGKVECALRVARNYGMPGWAEAETDGDAFVPPYPGVYTLEYTARDAFGNTAVKTVRVEAVKAEALPQVTIALDAEPVASVGIGEPVAVPGASAAGGSGSLSVSVGVTDPSGADVPVGEGAFLPVKTGDYTIVWATADYIGGGGRNAASVTRTVSVLPRPLPVLRDALLPYAALSGADVTLPPVSASDYDTDPSGGAPPSASVTASISNGTGTATVTGNTVRAVITTPTADMTVVYSAGNSKGTVTKSYTVKVVNPESDGRLRMERYFVTESGGFNASAGADGLTFTPAAPGSAMRFANPVLANRFQLGFVVPAAYNGMDGVTVTLYDSFDPSVSVRFDIVKNTAQNTASGASLLSVNGGAQKACAGNFYGGNAPLGFAFNGAANIVYDTAGTALATVSATEAGKPFSGFPSGKVYARIAVGSYEGSAPRLRLIQLNNQPLQDVSDKADLSDADTILPEFTRFGYLPLQVEAGQTVTIPAAAVQDVLSPRAFVTVTVTGSGGAVLLMDEDISSPKQITVGSSGTYRVVYNYWDSHNPDFVQSSYNNGNVMEYEPPVLTVGGAVPATAKVGTAVKLPAAEATDNATAAARIKINVYIVLPNGDALFFAVAREGESGGTEYVGPTFTPAAAGRYVIRYVATDACENYAVKEFVLTAE